MDVTYNSYYSLLDAERKRTANAFIEFLYHQQVEDLSGDETAVVIKKVLNGEELIGPFNSVEEMMRSLDA